MCLCVWVPRYVINGMKKWITGGSMADYFTVAVKTGEGAAGISVMLVERERPGITARRAAAGGWGDACARGRGDWGWCVPVGHAGA